MANSSTQFGGFLTKLGIAQQANTAALGIPWNITHMLIGDAGGEPSATPDPTPDPAQTALVRQVHRAPLNALYQSPTDPAVLVAELVLPPETGGWWIRELALEDANGNFIAVAKPPPSYKPLLVQGSGRTQTIRMHVLFGNTANVSLKIDPSIVLATREYVDAAILTALNKQDFKHSVQAATAAAIVLSGAQTIDGVALQAGARVLVKDQAQAKDNGIYVVAPGAWARAADADASAEVTPGLFVHVEQGSVNGDSVWQLVTDAPITLGTTALAFEMIAGRTGVTAGAYTKITVDKYGRVVGGTNPATLAGMGISDAYTKAEVDAIIAQASALPVGATVAFPRSTVPPGFLELDGSVQNAATYPDLSTYLAGAFNKGDEPAGYFRLPDSRGEFLRGWDHGRGVNPGRAIGSWQADEVKEHMHYLNAKYGGGSGSSVAGTVQLGLSGQPDVSTQTQGVEALNGDAMGGAETRPRSIAVMWCIKGWNAPVNQGQIDVAALAASVQALTVARVTVGESRNARMVVPAASATATWQADELVVKNALGGMAWTLSTLSVILNLATVGVGGMNIGPAPANGYVAIYVLYNPQTNLYAGLAVNATAGVSPEVYAGAMPTGGFTASALVAVVPTDAAGKIKPVVVQGRMHRINLASFYQGTAVVVGAPVSIAGVVPPNAKAIYGELGVYSASAASVTVALTSEPGIGQVITSVTVPAGGQPTLSNYSDVPLSTPQVVCVTTAMQSGNPTFYAYCAGYRI